MHERLSSLPYKVQMGITSKVRVIAKHFLRTELISQRSPYLESNFETYKALRESGFKLSSIAIGVSRRPVRIKDIVEAPLTAMDGSILSYYLHQPYRVWVKFMKKLFRKLDKGILVLSMHSWFQMKYDFTLELNEFLTWMESFRGETWIGSLDDLIYNSSLC